MLVVVAALGCARQSPPEITAAPGQPLPDLSAAELDVFERGRLLFNRSFSDSEGLGPLYNQARCSSCHDLPTLGGSGLEDVRKATRFNAETGCDPLRAFGGDALQERATAALAAHGIRSEPIPDAANGVANVSAPALYGLGLVERVPEDTLLALADAEDRDGDGIAGRAARLADGRLGRFGQKASHATLRGFIAGALIEEMGLTSPPRPAEERPLGSALPEGADPVPDPEVGAVDLDLLEAYVAGLAPVERERPESWAARDSVADGEAVFEAIGCAACHVPALPVQRSDGSAGTVRMYSDFLLHDMGPERADICGPDAAPSELRTAVLAGLRFRQHLMHNAAAERTERAIELHGGEALPARSRFSALAPGQRALLLRFLDSL